MKPLVDDFPFPFKLPEAAELHSVLCELYPTSKGAMFVAVRAGLDPSKLFADQPAYLLWADILAAGATSVRNREVVKVAREQNPNNPRCGFLDALLSGSTVKLSIDQQPRGVGGAPVFLLANDQVTEPEALLFHDDLTLPIGRVPWLISALGRLQQVAAAVCRLEASWAAGGQRGTAFRIAPSTVLTNWHVLHNADQKPTTVTVEFGYDDDGKGGGVASTAVACDVKTIKGDPADDWAIIDVSGTIAQAIPVLKLSDAVKPANAAPAFVIQHPGGERKRIAYVRNQITAFDDRVVQYLSDTQTGSSGSPVLNADGRLIALHHAGGRPQEVAGKTPIRKNEGIRIERIRNSLAKMGHPVP